jgi:hypothetical protein
MRTMGIETIKVRYCSKSNVAVMGYLLSSNRAEIAEKHYRTFSKSEVPGTQLYMYGKTKSMNLAKWLYRRCRPTLIGGWCNILLGVPTIFDNPLI